MKITKLEAENFKRLVAVSINPDGSTVVLGGANGAGKSSALDAIEWALGGAKHAPAEPIRKGAKSARVLLETEEIVVTRKQTPKGSQLEVKARDGAAFPSPQSMLDSLVGSLSFDPLAFTRLKAKEQAETLRGLVGLDFAAEDAKRAKAYEKRTEVGREIRRLQGALDKMPEPPAGTPDAEVSVAELASELQRRQEHNAANSEKRREVSALRNNAMSAKAEVERLEAALFKARQVFEEINAKGREIASEVKQLVDEDIDAIRAQIATAEQTNAAVRAHREREKLQAELDAQIDESEGLTQYIEQIDQVKADAAAKAQYPIPGLAITDDGITLAGVPFEQASSAEQLRCSVAIGLAMNPKLKVLLIRDGSLLDPKSLQMVAEMAAAADAQVWIERVSEGSECSVIIEDGSVRSAQTEAEAA